MKWIPAAFMLLILAGVATSVFRSVEFELVMGILIGPMLVVFSICFWRLYRIRRKERKKTPLPGYWELRAELWDPLAWYDQLWVIVFCCGIGVCSLALATMQKISPEDLFIVLPSSGLSAVFYVIACYGNRAP